MNTERGITRTTASCVAAGCEVSRLHARQQDQHCPYQARSRDSGCNRQPSSIVDVARHKLIDTHPKEGRDPQQRCGRHKRCEIGCRRNVELAQPQ